MNKKKFDKILNKGRSNKSISLYFIETLFRDEKKSLFGNEKIENLIADNFSGIMECVGRGNVDSFIDTLYRHESMVYFLEKDETVKYVLDNVEYDDFELIINDSLIKTRAQKFIHDNLDYVLNSYSIKKVVSIYQHIKFDVEELEKFKKYFTDKKEKFLKEILTNTLSLKGNVDDSKLNTLISIVTKVVDGVFEKENRTIIDIEILMSGSFSNVLRIGDTIVKVGIPRKTFDIPNDKRILQPYLRRDLSEEFGIDAVIEVSDRVDTDIFLNEGELYEIYKDMRSRGIVCGDFKYDNIGKLLKPNIPHNNDLNGIVGEVNEILGVGDYVIIDTDFIYKEDDYNLELSSGLSKKFESRYRKEKISKKT